MNGRNDDIMQGLGPRELEDGNGKNMYVNDTSCRV